MARTFMDDDLLTWEAYVSGGQPDTPEAARIFFLCLDSPLHPARFVSHDSRSVATAERELLAANEDDLRAMLARSVEND
ncbi:MAG: hypothetical protein RRA92_10820 [Gemmatimonadota bacterium]|nr:hypothetical protein [Gemmatimonadota bacterium]